MRSILFLSHICKFLIFAFKAETRLLHLLLHLVYIFDRLLVLLVHTVVKVKKGFSNYVFDLRMVLFFHLRLTQQLLFVVRLPDWVERILVGMIQTRSLDCHTSVCFSPLCLDCWSYSERSSINYWSRALCLLNCAFLCISWLSLKIASSRLIVADLRKNLARWRRCIPRQLMRQTSQPRWSWV